MARRNIFYFVYHQDAAKFETLGWEYDGHDDGVTARYRWAGEGAAVWPPYDEEMAARALEEFDNVWPGDGQ